jgi:CheY-like chemotaxis protein
MNAGQGKQPTIFLIEEDEETRKPLVQNLRGYGYRVVAAADEQDALQMVGGGGLDADLVLVNLIEKSAEEVLRVGRRVLEHAKYDGHTPLVVMPEKYGKDVEGTNVNAGGNEWVLYLGDEADQLRNLIARLLPV